MASFLNRAFGAVEHLFGVHNDPTKKQPQQPQYQPPKVNLQNLQANSVRQAASQKVQQQQQQQQQAQIQAPHASGVTDAAHSQPTIPQTPAVPQTTPFINNLVHGGLQVPAHASQTYHDPKGNVIGWEDNQGSHLTQLGQQQQSQGVQHPSVVAKAVNLFFPNTEKLINTVGAAGSGVGSLTKAVTGAVTHNPVAEQHALDQADAGMNRFLQKGHGMGGQGGLFENAEAAGHATPGEIARKSVGGGLGVGSETLPFFVGAPEASAGVKAATIGAKTMRAGKVVTAGGTIAAGGDTGQQLVESGHVNPAESFRSFVMGGASAGLIHGGSAAIDKTLAKGTQTARDQIVKNLQSNPELLNAYTNHVNGKAVQEQLLHHLATNPVALNNALGHTAQNVIAAIPNIAGNEAAVASIHTNPALGDVLHHAMTGDEQALEHSLRQLVPGADDSVIESIKTNLTGKKGIKTEATPEAAKLQEQKAAEDAATAAEQQKAAQAQAAEEQKVAAGADTNTTAKPTQGAIIDPDQVAAAAAHSNPVEIYKVLKQSNVPDNVAIAAAQDLKHITDPEQVATYLNNKGILADSGADAAAAKGEQVANTEAQQLAAADNVQEGTPAPDVNAQEAAIQNDAPSGAPSADNPTDQAIAQNATPTEQPHPMETQADALDAAAETGKTAEFKQTVQDKLDRGLPLTPEERQYVEQKTVAQQTREVAAKEKAQAKQGVAAGQQDIFGNEVPKAEPDTVAPEHTTMQDTAQRVTPGGEIKTIAKGAQGEGLGTLQRQMVADVTKLHSVWTGLKQGVKEPIRNIERIFRNAPELAQMFKDAVVYPMNDATAAATTETNANITKIAGVFKGTNKKQQELAGVILENMSKSANLRKLKEANPKDFEAALAAAKFGQQWFKENLAAINDMLVSVGQKPVKSLNDYLPHLNELNNNDKFRALMESGNYNQFGQPNGTPAFFMKHREGGANYSTNLFDAMMTYNKAAVSRKHFQPVIANLDNVATMVQGIEEMNPRTQHMILNTIQNMRKQLAPTAEDMGDPTTNAVVNLVNRGLGKLSHNVLGWSVSVATKNLIPLAQAMGEHNPAGVARDFASAIVDGVKHGHDLTSVDGLKVPFLVSRAGVQDVSKGAVAAYKRMGDNVYESPDIFVAHALVKGEMRRLRSANPGISDADLVHRAGEAVGKVMADRSAGMRAGIIANKRASVLTNFQTEPLNYLNHIMNDIIGNNQMGVVTKGAKLGGIAAAGYAGNQGFGHLMGQKPMIDPLGDAQAATNFVNQQEQVADDKGKPLTEGEKAKLWAGKFLLNGVQRMPFSNIATDVYAGAAPNNPYGVNAGNSQALGGSVIGQYAGNVIGDVAKGKWGKLPGDTVAPLVHGGSQIRKSFDGLTAFAKGSEQAPTNPDGTPGDTKFNIKQDPMNLVRSGLYGKYSTPEGQNYVNSGFKTQTNQDIVSGKVDPATLTPQQLDKYKNGLTTRFTASLNPEEKKAYDLLNNSDAQKLALRNGKITQQQLDDVQAKENQMKFKAGLPLTYVNGISDAQYQRFSQDPALKNLIDQASLQGKTKFSKGNIDAASQSIMEEAAKNAWPGVGTIKPTNKMALDYLTFVKDVDDHPGDQAEAYSATRKFWRSVVKTQYSDAVAGIYENATDASTNDTSKGYSLSVKDIKRLASGVTLNGQNYKLTKTDVNHMIELDNRLLTSGLIDTPKFSNSARKDLGYGDAPGTQTGLGYTPKSGSGSGSGGGANGSAAIADQHSSSFITNFGASGGGGGGGGDFLSMIPKQTAAPQVNLGKYKAPTSKASRIVINL